MGQKELPSWLNDLCMRLHKDGIFPIPPNHVLINEYRRDEGISFHKDGPMYFPRVAILSLHGTIKIDFKENLRDDVVLSALLEPQSLLIFENDAYTDCFHGIREELFDVIDEKVLNKHQVQGDQVERTVRVSLTIRIVHKASKSKDLS